MQRVSTLVFVVVFGMWLETVPSPWFEREANGVVSFNYHPVCMTLAFVVLMPEAIVVYADGEDGRGITHVNAKRIHTVVHCVSTLFLLMGLMAIFANHKGHNIPPMYSAHSWMGLLTTILVGLQALVGFGVYFFKPVVSSLASADATNQTLSVSELRKNIMPYHRFFGCAAFVLGLNTCISGFVEKQAFTKCAIDPTYKYCAALALPNVLVVLVATIGSCSMGIVYARHLNRSPDRAQWVHLTPEEQREDARSALMSARQRRARGTEEIEDLEY